MAPVPYLTARAYKNTYRPPHTPSGGSIGGSVIGAIIILMIIIFICVLIHGYRKAKRNRPLTTPPTPLPWGNILKNAILIALTFGLVAVCCAGCLGDTDAPAPENTGGVEMGGVQNEGFIPQPAMQVPNYQPDVNWNHLQNTAADQVQG